MKEFNLPLRVDLGGHIQEARTGKTLGQFVGTTPAQDTEIIHAVNRHDELVGLLTRLTKCSLSDTEEDLLDEIHYLLGVISDERI